jgi:hypothetical protein
MQCNASGAVFCEEGCLINILISMRLFKTAFWVSHVLELCRKGKNVVNKADKKKDHGIQIKL